MAFFSKAGNILKQTVSKHINSEIYGSNPSVFQILRCMSSSKLFVGGISYATDDISLREAFNKYGEVIEARVIVDRESGRSRGFGFVTFTSGDEASAAIQALDGQDLHGRRVRVNYANDRAPRGGGFGGGGYGGGGGGYGGGYGAGGYGGGAGGSFGGGGGYGGADNYGGGNYGTGGGYGGSNYGSGGSGDSYSGGNFEQGGTYANGTGFDSGSSGNYRGGSQSLGVAGVGGSSSDNYVSGNDGVNDNFASGGDGGSTGLGYSGAQFGSNESSNMADASGGIGQDDPIEGNFRDNDDDDEPGDDLANRRA